jgi:ADP-ribosyl-[dinitrogen reductase] hydrolase
MNLPPANRNSALRELVSEGKVRMCWSSAIMERDLLVDAQAVSDDRVRGMLMGLAIGDSLGNTTEGLLPRSRRESHGEIRDYLPNWYADNRAVGVPSDDTQLAFWTLEHLIDKGHVEPAELAHIFASRQIFKKGPGTGTFVNAINYGKNWLEAAQHSAGNSALARAPATVVPHIWNGGSELWVDAAFAVAVIHNDPAAIGAGIAFAAILSDLLTMNAPPGEGWWVDRFVEVAREIEGENVLKPRGGPLVGEWWGPLWQFVQHYVPQQAERTVLEASELWYSGSYLLETVPTVLHILMRHAGDLEEAIIRAVNDTKDNDSIAAIVGAAVGALHGSARLPDRWKQGLLGRTQESDDGRIFELIDQSIRRFGPGTGNAGIV